MRLQDAILGVARQPGSTRARVDLAMMLQQFNVPQAPVVWDAAARVAAARGDFFDALSVCRLHLTGAQQSRFLEEVLNNYMNTPEYGAERPSAPQPRGGFQLPRDVKALIQLGVQLGADLSNIQLSRFVNLPEIPIFGDLPEGLLRVLVQSMVPVPLQRGEHLIRQGNNERSCYLVTQGRMRVVQERPDGSRVDLAQLDAPAVMGEISLLTSVSRRASVIAETTMMAWRIDASLLSHLGQMHPSLIPQIRTLIRMRLVSNLMRSNQLFAELNEHERFQFLQAFSMHTAEPGSEAMREGLPTTGLFILMHGKAVVKHSASGDVGELNEGDIFGAPSFFSGQPSLYTILLPEGGLLLQLTSRAYHAVCKAFPQLDSVLRELEFMPY